MGEGGGGEHRPIVPLTGASIPSQTVLAPFARHMGRWETPERVRGAVKDARETGAPRAMSSLAAAVIALAAVLVATGRPDAAAEPQPEVQAEADGDRLYGRDCASCHGPAGEGSFRGPRLTDVGAASVHFYVATGRMPIADPNDPVRRKRASRYSEEEIRAIVDHTSAFVDGPAVPQVDVAEADLALGGSLYRTSCAPCHSVTGIGGALAYGELAPPVLHSTSTEVAESIIVGPGAMPSFSAFSDDEIAAVAAHVQHLADPVDEGGWPLARAGRVDEGLVAWVFGIGALLLVARWIGTRAR